MLHTISSFWLIYPKENCSFKKIIIIKDKKKEKRNLIIADNYCEIEKDEYGLYCGLCVLK